MRSMLRQTASVRIVLVAAALAGCGSSAPRRPVPALGHRSSAAPDRAVAGAVRVATAGPAARSVMTSGDADSEPHASDAQVSAARKVARAFFTSYVAFLYGRLPARRVRDADRSLRLQFARGHATTTPAERASRARVGRVSLTSSGPPVSVLAVAVVAVIDGPPSRLTATLEPYGRTWIVVAVAE